MRLTTICQLGLAALPMFALAACGGPEEAPPPAVTSAALPVTLAAARPAASEHQLVISGIVRLKRETTLGFNAPGRIAVIAVREGDMVKKGDVLARLDLTSLAAATATAEAELARAESDYTRLQGLFAQGWVTAPRVETARATLDAARARVRQSRFDQGLGIIRAPSSGTILRRPLEPGQIVQPGQTVLVLGETDSGHVLQLPVADADLPRLRLGQPARVLIDALSAAPLAATVSEIGARGDEATGTFRVELALPAHPGLRSGLIGEARLALPDEAATGGALAVPATALFSARAGEAFVYVHDSKAGVVRLRQVAIGPPEDDEVIVTAGLEPGEQVVTSGPDRLRDGMAVSPSA